MPRLPASGADAGQWGEILNDFLSQEHAGDGTHRIDSAWVDARKFGAAMNQDTIIAALNDIGSKERTLLLAPGTWTISSVANFPVIGSYTRPIPGDSEHKETIEYRGIPENVTLFFMRGAILHIEDGVSLGIDGSIQAGLWQIFSGPGRINYERVWYPQETVDGVVIPAHYKTFGLGIFDSVYTRFPAAWFGWSSSASDTDNYKYLSKAITAANGKHEIHLGIGTFELSIPQNGPLIVHGTMGIVGAGRRATEIKVTSNRDVFHMGSLQPYLRDFRINTEKKNNPANEDYTQSVITISSDYSYIAKSILLERLELYGDPYKGRGIFYNSEWRIDPETGERSLGEINHTQIRDIYIRGYQYGIKQKINGGVINNNRLMGIQCYKSEYGFYQQMRGYDKENKKQHGGMSSNYVEISMNGSRKELDTGEIIRYSKTGIHLESTGNTFRTSFTDIKDFTGDLYELLGYTDGGFKLSGNNSIIETNNFDPRNYACCDSLNIYEFVYPGLHKLVFPFGNALPSYYHVSASGTGGVAMERGSAKTMTLRTGNIINDVVALSTHGRAMFDEFSQPWMHFNGRFPNPSDHKKVEVKMGLDEDGGNSKFFFIADPAITANWRFYIKDGDNTEYIDTGEPLDDKEHAFEIYLTGQRDRTPKVHANIDQKRVATYNLTESISHLEPFFQVKTKENLTPPPLTQKVSRL